MSSSRRVRSCAWALGVGIAVAVPGSASGAVTFGSDLGATALQGSFGCAPACTFAHATLPLSSQAPGGLLAPSDGVVVRWRIKVGPISGASGSVAIRITRPGNSATRIGVGTGPPVFPPSNQTTVYDARLPIQAGDALGIDCCAGAGPSDALFAFSNTPTASGWRWSLPPLIDGRPRGRGLPPGVSCS